MSGSIRSAYGESWQSRAASESQPLGPDFESFFTAMALGDSRQDLRGQQTEVTLISICLDLPTVT